MSIGPRTEMVVKMPILNPLNLKEGLILSQALNKKESLIIPSALVKVINNNEALITVINRSLEKEIFTKPSLPLLRPPEQSHIFYSSNSGLLNKRERLALIHKNIRTEHLNTEEKNSIIKLCHEFEDIFHLPGDTLTVTNAATNEIRTTDNIPIHAKSYRYPEVHKNEVSKQINKMLAQGIIKPSTSPWSSPLWVVPKKIDASGQKKWRIVIDYRNLNEKTIGDAYPLPHIEDILDQLGHAHYFTTLDLASGFHQIPMHPDDAQKTAFSTPEGHFEFTRMPFGLKNALAVFQRMIHSVLTRLSNKQCFVYLDDVVIHGSSLTDHNLKLRNVFNRFREHYLKLQPDKCEFLHESC